MEEFLFLGVLFVPIVLISFLATLLVLPKWIKRAKKEGLTSKDVHKKKSNDVANGGGITVLIGFVIGVLLYIGVKTFYFQDTTNLIETLGLLSLIGFVALIGIFDDLLGWKKGLGRKFRILMVFFSSIILMVLNVGQHTSMGIDFGIIYPLILVPLAIVGTTTTFNFLAGYNGLEASQGILILLGLSIVNFIAGNWWLSLIGMCMVASLFAFYFFNKYPAKVFPGDLLTYPVGAMIGAIAILGNIEKIALFFFIPYIIEFFLKSRGKLVKESFSKVEKDGSLSPLYPKIYGLEHIAVRILRKVKRNGKAYEWEVPLLINLFQLIIIVLGFVLFF